MSTRPQDGAAAHALALAAYAKQDFAEAFRQFMQAYNFDSSLLASSRIQAAHTAMLAAPWGLMEKLLGEKTLHFLTSGWLTSLFIGKPVNAQGEPIPWYTYPAIDFLQEKIPPGATVFEWGSGNSTSWWARRAAQVISIEDDENWYNLVLQELPPNAKLSLVKDPEHYVHSISRQNADSYDIIVIDGAHRNECAGIARSYLKPDGLIVFDNSDGRQFSDGLRQLDGLFRIDFFGLIPSYLYKNCTSVFFSDPAVLGRGALPADINSCVGITCWQATDGK